MVTFQEAMANEPDADEIKLHQEIIVAEAARIAEKYECTINEVLENIAGAGTCLIDEDSNQIYAFLRSDKPIGSNAAFFGGKVEEGEHAVVAAIRETFEESGQKLGISIEYVNNGIAVPVIELVDNTVDESHPVGKFFIGYIVKVNKGKIDHESVASHQREGTRVWMSTERFKSESGFKYYVAEVMKRYEMVKK